MNRRTLLLSAPLLLAPKIPFARPFQGLVIAASPQRLPPLVIGGDGGDLAAPDVWAGRAVLLNLWASWCLPCVSELPALDRLASATAPRGIEVVALSLDHGGTPAARAAYTRMGIRHLAVRVDAGVRAAEVLGAPMLPTTVLIDARGREQARFIGAAEWDSPAARPLLDALASGGAITPALAPPLAKPSGAQPP